MFSAADHEYMARALRLAAKGLYSASPNPRVGCVIVNDGKVVGEGWHEKSGEPHAEVHALKQAGALAGNAAVYVTLEPCSHFGRTPPCADALIKAGVGRVVIAMQDPNPLVAGSGGALLQQAGIKVECGLMETQARELNRGFVSRMTRNRPWVRIKTATSLDGKTALNNGISFWITGEAARRDVQRLRAGSCALLTGINTVLLDDPQLNVREIETPRQPWKIILDSRLRTPPSARIMKGGRVLIITASADKNHRAALEDAGAEILELQGADGRVNLSQLMLELGGREINELLVEAGCTVNGALLEQGLVDEIVMYVAPSLLGDKARGMFALPELTEMSQRRQLAISEMKMVGPDLRIRALLH